MFDYIERFYNPKRRHSTIGYVSPMEFEKARISLSRCPPNRQQANSDELDIQMDGAPPKAAAGSTFTGTPNSTDRTHATVLVTNTAHMQERSRFHAAWIAPSLQQAGVRVACHGQHMAF